MIDLTKLTLDQVEAMDVAIQYGVPLEILEKIAQQNCNNESEPDE